MSMRRTFGVLIVVLAVAVPELLACGDKFLVAGRFTTYQRPKNARGASILIYAAPASAMAAAFKNGDIESRLKRDGHLATKVQTHQELLTTLSNGHFDVILTASGDQAEVKGLVPASADAAIVLPVNDLLKKGSLPREIDKAVVQRDKNVKKQRDQEQKQRDQDLKKKTTKGF